METVARQEPVEERVGCLPTLFDLSFTQFITTRIVRFLYVLSLAICLVGAVALVIAGFLQAVEIGVAALILSPVVFLLLALASRVYWEMVIVLFRVAEHTAEIASQGRQR